MEFVELTLRIYCFWGNLLSLLHKRKTQGTSPCVFFCQNLKLFFNHSFSLLSKMLFPLPHKRNTYYGLDYKINGYPFGDKGIFLQTYSFGEAFRVDFCVFLCRLSCLECADVRSVAGIWGADVCTCISEL